MNSKINIQNKVDRNSFYYIGKEHNSDLKDIGSLMEKDLADLCALSDNGQLPKPDTVLSIYKKFDMVNGKCLFVTGFGYKEEQKNSRTQATKKQQEERAQP